MPTINTSLAPSLPLGSPTRGLHARQQSPRTLLRHRQPGFNAYDTPCKAWIADTLHQLHKSTVPRAALFSTGRQSELCKICRTPLSGASPQRACSGSPNSQSRPLRRNTLCYSVAAELQTSTAGGDSGPPGGRSGDGGGGGGGSNDPHNNAVTASQTPLRETMSAQGLEDIILFDVQGIQNMQMFQHASSATC